MGSDDQDRQQLEPLTDDIDEFRRQLQPLRLYLNEQGAFLQAEEAQFAAWCRYLREVLRPLVEQGLSIDLICVELNAPRALIDHVVHTDKVPRFELTWVTER